MIDFYLHYYNPNGERRRISAGTSDERTALLLARKFETWLLEGRDPESEIINDRNSSKFTKINLEGLFPIFMDRHSSTVSENTRIIYENRFKNIRRCKELSNIPIHMIKKAMVSEYVSLRLKEGKDSNATINREIALIKNMLNRAVEWDMIKSTSLTGFRILKEASKREVELSVEQAGRLIGSFTGTMKDVVEFAFLTGLRKEEIFGSKLEMCIFNEQTKDGKITVKTKGGNERSFPLSNSAVRVIKRAARGRKSGCIF